MVQKYPLDSHMLIMEQHLPDSGDTTSANSMETSKNKYQNSYSSTFNIIHGTPNHPPEADKQHEDDFFKSLKGFLIFGKLIGVLPHSGIFGNSWRDLSFKKKSFSAFLSYGIVLILVFNLLIGLVELYRTPKRNALELANSLRLLGFNGWGCLIYIIFLRKHQTFLDIFKVWTSNKIIYSRRDQTLGRDIWIIAGGILTSGILENVVLNLEYFKSLDKYSGYKYKDQHNNMTEMEAYYWRAYHHWPTAIGYNWFFLVLAFFHHKWLLYSWNYVDAAIAVFGRAMYFRFKCLCEESQQKLLGSPGKLRSKHFSQEFCDDQQTWLNLVHDHKNLCKVLEALEHFFSPLVFLSYLVNIFFISMQLLDGLTSELSKHSIVHSIYAPWSFLHLVMRTFIVSICCAKINMYAHKIKDVLQDCPQEHYLADVSRVDLRVTAGPDIGLTGLGCFTVTKPFILSMLSVVFTFEIVLLQCVPPT